MIASTFLVLPALAIVGIATAVASLVGGLAISSSNRKAQKKQNQADREFTEYMYNLERKDAQKDWDTQNAYNSPEEQMNRLRQAGLNPNLVYGKGADNTAMAIRSVNHQKFNQQAPQSDSNAIMHGIDTAGSQLGQYYDVKRTQAQTDNLNEQKNLMTKEALLTEAKTANTISSTATTDFQRKQALELHDNVIKKAQLDNDLQERNIKKLDQQMVIDMDRNDRERLKNAVDVQATLQSILESKSRVATNEVQRKQIDKQIELLKYTQENTILDGKMKAIDVQLAKSGIYRTDPLWLRSMLLGADKLKQQAVSNVLDGVGQQVQGK